MFLPRHFIVSTLAVLALCPVAPAQAPAPPATPRAVMIEAEDFTPPAAGGWKVIKNGEGNMMVDIIGFNHISGERVLSAAAGVKDAVAIARVQIPEAGPYRVWSRFEQPTSTDNRFRVELLQSGKSVGAATMGEREAPKFFFGASKVVAQADPSWGSEGLVEQGFDVAGLQKGEAEIILTALDQSGAPAPRADRNIDFLFLTQDLEDTWREQKNNRLYPILDAALQALPTRYFLRMTSPEAQTITVSESRNRNPWGASYGHVKLAAGTPSEWLPLRAQDVSHFTTIILHGSATTGLKLRAEFASAPVDDAVLRTINWEDPQGADLLVGLPPYPNKYPGEKIMTVEEQYRSIRDYLQAHPSKVGREPKAPLAWGSSMPIWTRGRVPDAAAEVYHEIGLCLFAGAVGINVKSSLAPTLEVVRERFARWGLEPSRSLALALYRNPPNAKNIADAKQFAEDNGLLPYIERYDYGDEISFKEWLSPLGDAEIKTRFATWQQKHRGRVEWEAPSSTAETAKADPHLYVDSLRFYEEATIDYVASEAKGIRPALGKEVLFGANVAAHPFYYPEIAKYVRWFRPTESGDYAANFGRHSEYFWQIGQPGPLINAYIADHFRAGMRDNPEAVNLQYTMPHSPGNSDTSFRRSAFSHLAHGARGLDYFGIGVNNSFTENYIDFRDPERFAAIRDINRSMATIEDILPQSRVTPSEIALILSDSTERWDFAGIAQDRAGTAVFADDYKTTRLAYHLDRVGIYYALIHAGRSPDLLIESDVQRGDLQKYKVAYWVGDCAEAKTVAVLQKWVEAGGHLVATAGALRYDEYRHPQPAGAKLLGLPEAKLDAREWFFRPQIELPRMTPLDFVQSKADAKMPVIGLRDVVTAGEGAQTLGAFADGSPAVVESKVGQGKSTFLAALPGVAYFWSAYQAAGGPEFVPTRGVSSHLELTGFDPAARAWITAPVADLQPAVEARSAKVDARLITSSKGDAIVLANYESDLSKPIILHLRIPQLKSVHSAAAGSLKLTPENDGSQRLEYAPGAGDILRLER